MKLKKNDQVIVITGKCKGNKGKIIKVFPKDNKVIVAGVNVVKKHTKPSANTQGGIVHKELPIHISNIAYFDGNGASKIGFYVKEDGSKVRMAKKTGKLIEEGN